MKNTMRENNSAETGKWRTPALLSLAAMAASAWAVHLKTQQAERAFPPKGKFIDVDGVRLHYLERGSGDPLVLLHGNGAMAEDFELSGLSGAAAVRHRVIVFDRPGYGYSERPQSTEWTPTEQATLLHRALQQLGIERPVIVGHSWGTQVAIAWALQFPQDVRGLVLLSGYYYPSMRPDTTLMATPALPVIGTLMRYTTSPLSGRLLWPVIAKQLFSPAEVAPQFQQSYPVWLALRPTPLLASAEESGMMVPSAKMLSQRYRELTMPIFIMAGADDKISNPKHNAQQLHDELPHSLLRIKPGIGHMIHYACANEIVAAIHTVESLATPTVLSLPLSRQTMSSSLAGGTQSGVGGQETLH